MRTSILSALLLFATAQSSIAATTVTIINLNAPGVGFNDPTPVAPVGGNTGTTFGQQALIAFQRAADIWGQTLDSKAEVKIAATFEPLACTATAGTLGSAGALAAFGDFPGAEKAGTWYHAALASKLAGEDLTADDPGDPTAGADIRARFNSNIGKPGCLTASGWYLGLDNNHGANQIDLVTVLLHEFAHGLGFSSFANVSSGKFLLDSPDIYSYEYFDNSTQKDRVSMTDLERKASAINPRNVVWVGDHVTADLPTVLQAGTPLLIVSAPAAIAGDYQVGAAAFGPAITSAGVSGTIVVATDAADVSGPSTTDGCTAITNAASVAGRIALVDRGTCGFVVKVKNAQNAGAIAVLVADNVAGGPPAGMGGADATITIPSVRITLADGQTIKAALATSAVTASLSLDMAVRSGADRSGRALLYTPNPVQPGSSVSHWDTSTTPNQLMEPAINADLTHSVGTPEDLTRAQLRDIGWYPDADLDMVPDDDGDQCLGSHLGGTVIVGGIDTGVANTFFTNGCSIVDLVSACKSGSGNAGAYASCGATLTNTLRNLGFISGSEKGTIQSAIARDH